MKIAVILLVSFCWLCRTATGQVLPLYNPEAEEIIHKWGGWRKLRDPKVVAQMSEEERQVLRAFCRNGVKEDLSREGKLWYLPTRPITHREELLYLGDPEIVAKTVAASLASDPLQPDLAGQELYKAALPEVIPMVAPRIFVDEPYVFTSFGDNGGTIPKSYGYAGLIRSTLEKSPVFGDEVRNWAKLHWRVTSQQLLPVMRQWWKENEPFFKEKNYRAVKPGIDIYTAEKAKRDALRAREQAYADSLRAQGKDPRNLRYWEGWEGRKYDPDNLARFPEITTPSPKPPLAPQKPGVVMLRRIPAWCWGLGLLVLAGIGAFAWMRRGR